MIFLKFFKNSLPFAIPLIFFSFVFFVITVIPLANAQNAQYVFLKKFSAICKNKFDIPLDIVVDSKNNTYTIDSDHCLQKISHNGTILFRLNVPSSTGLLALDSSDNLFSLQYLGLDNYAINRFAPSGAKLPNINQSDINATIKSPKGIAVDSSDNIYIATDGLLKYAGIKKFDSNGKFLNNYTNYAINLTSGETDRKKIRNPGGIDVDPLDNVYVVDNRPFSFFSPPILKFSSNGTFIKYSIINNQTTGTGINHVPKDIATDSRGNLYVLDNFPVSCFSAFRFNGPSFSYCIGGSVQKFSSEGVFIRSIINALRGPDGIELFPENMDVDSFDDMYITDASSNQIFVLAPNKTPAIPFS